MSVSLEWLKQNAEINTTSPHSSPSICCDGTYIYAVYTTSGALTGKTNSGNTDIIVVKLDLNGNLIWASQDGDFNTSGHDMFPSICCDSSGVFIASMYVQINTFPTPNVEEIRVHKFDKSNGSVIWFSNSSSFNSSGTKSYPKICSDNNSRIFVTYKTSGALSGSTRTGTPNDVVVFSLDKDSGNLNWAQQSSSFNTTGNNDSPFICCDGTYVYVAYSTTGTISGGTYSGSGDIIVFCMTLTGTFQWAKQDTSFNSSSIDIATSISGNTTEGGFYMVYQTMGTISGGTLTGSSDIVVYKGGTDGSKTWAKQESSFNISGSNDTAIVSSDSSGVYVIYRNSDASMPPNSKCVAFKLSTSGSTSWMTYDSSFTTQKISTPQIVVADNNNVVGIYTSTEAMSGYTAISFSDVIIFNLREGGAGSSNSCFSYETLQKIIDRIEGKKNILVFGGKRGNKKMFRCDIKDFGKCEFTHDHLFVYNNEITTFENLIHNCSDITNIEEVPVQEIDMMYNIIGNVTQLDIDNIFKLNDNVRIIGGRVKNEDKIEYVKSIL